MKRYLPLFILALVLIAIIGMSQYAESAKQHYEESTKQAETTAVAKGDHSEAENNAKQPYKPPVWAKYVTFPEGVGAWAVILTLFVIAWQSIETRAAAKATEAAAEAARDSIRMQEAGLAQWIELKPHGLHYTIAAGSSKPPKHVTINPSWRIVNSTPLPFTLTTIKVSVGRDNGWAVFEYDVDNVLPPSGDGKNYFTFSAPVSLTEIEAGQFLADVLELSISIDVFYLGAHGKEGEQSFGEFFVCKPGSLSINESLGKGPQRQRLEEYDGPSTISEIPGTHIFGSKESGKASPN